MAEKKGSEFQNGVSFASLLSHPAVKILIFVCIILVSVFMWFVVLDQMVQQTNDVEMSVQVSGNDIVVVVFESESAQRIRSLHAYIEGKTNRGSAMTRDHIFPGTAVVFQNLASDVSGTQFVIIEATFTDGSSGIVKYVRLLFS